MSKKRRDNGTRAVDDKYEEVRALLVLGKDRGYLAYDEINEMLPDEVSSSPDEIEEIFSLLEAQGIELVDVDTKDPMNRPETPAAKSKGQGAKQEAPEVLLEKTNDSI